MDFYALRKKLIETVSKTGGHLASNLGVVELTIALHYVFNSPKDVMLFDENGFLDIDITERINQDDYVLTSVGTHL
mgnify:CR=1 FL=1